MSEGAIRIIVLTSERNLWLTLEPFLDCLRDRGDLAGTWEAEMVSGTEAKFQFSHENDARRLAAMCLFLNLPWFLESARDRIIMRPSQQKPTEGWDR